VDKKSESKYPNFNSYLVLEEVIGHNHVELII